MSSAPPWPEHLDSLLPPSRLLKEQYRITGFVGEGGSGAVFKGVQAPLERPVAIKVMYPGHHSRVRERFLREAQAVAGLRHPNVVTIYDFGLIDQLRPFIVMELLHGNDLASALQQSGPMSTQRALPLFMECLEALAEAHHKGLVHRDLKPDNLYLSKLGMHREALQILDFGIALFTHDIADPEGSDDTLPGSPRLTPTGQKVGTPNYLAPEYFESGTVSPAMDVYAMGLVFVEMITGSPVVKASNFYKCVVQHITGNLHFPPDLMAGPLGPVIRKATARNPEERYTDAQAMLEALATVAYPNTNPQQVRVLATSGLVHSSPEVIVRPAPQVMVNADTEFNLPSSLAPEGFVLVRAGEFMMGSPEEEPGRNDDETLHKVILSRSFYLQEAPVTRAQWGMHFDTHPSRNTSRDDLPVESVSWYDAIAYCNALSAEEGLPDYYLIEGEKGIPGKNFQCQRVTIPDPNGEGYRLPTEAEWEYAVRADEDEDEPRYGQLARVSWYEGNSKRRTRPVKGMEPNAWGLYDMFGNVWEWVWDRYMPHGSRKVRNPTGPSKSPYRVQRGGSFGSNARICRAANRGHGLPHRRFHNVGFRVARTLP